MEELVRKEKFCCEEARRQNADRRKDLQFEDCAVKWLVRGNLHGEVLKSNQNIAEETVMVLSYINLR